jgi:hypothetical protein
VSVADWLLKRNLILTFQILINVQTVKGKMKELVKHTTDWVNVLTDVVTSIGNNVNLLFKSMVGCCMSLMIFASTYIGPNTIYSHWILSFMIIDLLVSIVANIKNNTFGLSKMLIKTPIKIAIYLLLFWMVVAIENVIGDDLSLGSRVICGIMCSIEFISISASLLILNPNLPILKLFSKFFVKEIANKLGYTEKEVKKLLNIK